MTDKTSVEDETKTDENTVAASATENVVGNSISDKLDPEVVAALSQADEPTTEEVPAEETPAETVESDENAQVEKTTDAPLDDDKAESPSMAVTGRSGKTVEEAASAEDKAESEPVNTTVEDDSAPETDAVKGESENPAEEPVEDTADPVKEGSKKDETVTAADEVDVPATVIAAFEEFVNGEEIDLYPKVSKINKTAFKNLLNSNQGYDLSASEAFRAEEDKQARKIATKALRSIFREQKIKMKPDEFEKEFPAAYESVLDLLSENDVSFAEWEAVTNSVGEQNFVHYVDDLALPFGTSSKQDIEEGVEKVISTLGLTNVDGGDIEKNKKAITTAVKKALKGNGDVKFAFAWRQNAADVVSYFPFETRIAEISNPILLAVAVKAADAPKSVKLDPITAQAKLAGVYTFEHRVTESSDGKTVSNVSTYVGDLPNKDSYYEREVEFDNPDEED